MNLSIKNSKTNSNIINFPEIDHSAERYSENILSKKYHIITELKKNPISQVYLPWPSEDQLIKNNPQLLWYKKILIFCLIFCICCINVFHFSCMKQYKKHLKKRTLEVGKLKRTLNFYKNIPKLHLIDENLLTDNLNLNKRQKDITLLILKGLTNNEIANKLFIAETTVKYHAKNIYKIYDVKNRAQLAEQIAQQHQNKEL